MRYLEVTTRVQRPVSDAAATLLTDIGSGVVIDDPLDVAHHIEQKIWEITDLVPGDPAWITLKIYLPETENLEEKRLQLSEAVQTLRSLDLGTVEDPSFRWTDDQDWANAWKQYFKPTRVGQRLMIIPSWETYELQPGELPLYLDPGMAFGTGTHPTTALCLRWLEDLIEDGSKVLDAGTGSGILAIAARRLGAGPILAFDLDPVAVKVARENLERNQVAAPVEESELAGPVVDRWLQEHGPADLIIANIIADVIIPITPQAFDRLRPGGRFLTSGIIDSRKKDVLAALEKTGFQVVDQREDGGWVAILAQKP